MTAQRHQFNEWLAVAGSVVLFLMAIPVFAVLIFVLRAALLAGAILGLGTGVALYVTSRRFRVWLNTFTEQVETYKGLRLSSDVAMHSGHGWARMIGADVMVGSDDLLPAVLGPVQRVEMPPVGQHVARGEMLFQLRRGDRSVAVPSPMDGIVVTNNEVLEREPGLVNADPFRRGWAVMLRSEPGVARDWNGLRRGQEAGAWFRGEVDRLLAAVQNDGGAVLTMADGGAVTRDFYMHIDDGAWRRVKETLGDRS